MKHPTTLREHHKDLEDLITDLGDLRYDALAKFLRLLSAKIDSDAGKDEDKGRYQLAVSLRDAAGHVSAASDCIKIAWRICKPHMPDSADG